MNLTHQFIQQLKGESLLARLIRGGVGNLEAQTLKRRLLLIKEVDVSTL